MVQSELKSLIPPNIVNVKFPCFDVKTGKFPIVQIFHMVRHVATLRSVLEPDPQPTLEFEPIANGDHHSTEHTFTTGHLPTF